MIILWMFLVVMDLAVTDFMISVLESLLEPFSFPVGVSIVTPKAL